jgi:hypothetical protein
VVDMSASNSWAELSAVFRRTTPAFQEHEGAKADLRKLVPRDAKEAIGQRHSGKALKIQSDQLRHCGNGGGKCTALVTPSGAIAAALAKAQGQLSNPEKSLCKGISIASARRWFEFGLSVKTS